jgi:hypothetical protein
VTIIDDLLVTLDRYATARKVRIGAFWTGVKLLTMTRKARFADSWNVKREKERK